MQHQPRKTKEANFTRRDYERIEQASVVIASLIAATLCFLFLYGVYPNVSRNLDQTQAQSIQETNEKYDKMKSKAKPEEIERVEQAREAALSAVGGQKMFGGGFFWLVGFAGVDHRFGQ